jgi:putative PIN family toxin of toxin-antitoxin system
MNTAVKRVVFDCNVYFQALTSPRGPAARLVDFALNGDISLFVSKYTLDELADVAARPQLVAKYGLEEAVVAKFISNLRSAATCINSVPHIFDFPRAIPTMPIMLTWQSQQTPSSLCPATRICFRFVTQPRQKATILSLDFRHSKS